MAGCVQHHREIADIFGSDGRVCVVICEELERLSDGARFGFERTVIYKIENDVIAECWIADRPAGGMKKFLEATA